MAVAVAAGPLVMSAAGHVQVDGVVAGAGAARIARRSIHGDCQLAGRRECDAEWIAQAVRPDGIFRAERIVRGDRAVRVVAEHLAADVVDVLRAGGIVLIPEGDVELAVRPEGDASALVAAVVSRREGGDD